MRLSLTAMLATAAGWGIILLAQPAAAQGTAERQVLVQAAEALGGRERIERLKTIELIGYGQYVYQFGGGNITAAGNAPMKYLAANDLRRVYDLEHGRFQQKERRNFLFPFAAARGHSYALVNLILDGDIAFNVSEEGVARRVPRWTESVMMNDGVHMRRMWMMNNPVAAVRAALASGSKVGNLRKRDGRTLLDVTLAQGDELTLAFEEHSSLPRWIRWTNPHDNLGQIAYTTWFSGYAPFDGIMLPLGYLTKTDWRNIDYLKIYVDNYVIDGQIDDLAAPASVRNAPEPPSRVVRPLETVKVADGIWRINTGTIVFEFEDHLTLFELGGSRHQAQAVIELARTLAPGKPVTQVVASHAHFDHVAGIRAAIAEGLTVISRRANEPIFRDIAGHRAPDFPDAQELNRRPLKFIPVDEHLRLSDEQMTVDLYWARANIHMADAIFAYVPAAKVLVEGDIATAALDYQFWADNYMDNVEHYDLDVDVIAPVHMQVMKHEEAIEMLKGGVQRARERCAAELAKGVYFAGCPIQTKRY